MTEIEAKKWIKDRFGVSRETQLAEFERRLRAEAIRQNLVSASSLDHFWARHIVDSAQLLRFAEGPGGWLDVGSGAGLPGLVIAILRSEDVTLVEPRARRVDFLQTVVDQMELANCHVVRSKVETFAPLAPFAVVSARAVAALPKLLASAAHCANDNTVWLLPKGQSAVSELEAARKAWQGSFHVEQSITQADSKIIVATGVRRR